MDTVIDKLLVNAPTAVAIIVVLVLLLKDRRADAADRRQGHEIRDREQRSRDQQFLDALRERDELYTATIREIASQSHVTAADCHMVHRESIKALERETATHERVVRVLEKIEKNVGT